MPEVSRPAEDRYGPPGAGLPYEELLATCRAVRRRLDLSRPVDPETIRACLELALQAPSGSNAQTWHFLVVTDPARRRALADIYRRAFDIYRDMPTAARSLQVSNEERRLVQHRVMASAAYLASHLHDVPVHVIPCFKGRADGMPSAAQAGMWGSILPATWSFMLAARANGLGSSLTTLHLMFEEEAAEVLGIPYAEVTQAALVPVAHTDVESLRPAPREPLDSVLHWDHW